VSGAIFAFIHSWDELVIVLFHRQSRRLHPAAAHLGRHQTSGSIRPWPPVGTLLILVTVRA